MTDVKIREVYMTPPNLFVCPHGVAESVSAHAYFQQSRGSARLACGLHVTTVSWRH